MAVNLFIYSKTNSIGFVVYCMSIVPNNIVQPCTRMSFFPALVSLLYWDFLTIYFPYQWHSQTKMCLVLHLRYMVPFFSTSFWIAFTKKKPFTKWFLQHAYINDNSTRSDCIHLYGHFVFICIFFFKFKIVSLFKHRSTR